MKPSIAFVVQRYGEGVLGGAESYCRMIAESMARHWDITIITTNAVDSSTWAPHFPESDERINGVAIRRFPVERVQDKKLFARLTKRLLLQNGLGSFEDSLKWLEEQGPYSSSLLDYIERQKDHFDCFFYFTALFPFSYFGILITQKRSILVPFAHDEPVMHFPVFKKLFQLPLGIIYSTDEEREFVHSFYNNHHIPSRVIGSGIRPPRPPSKNAGNSLKNLLPDRPYLLFAGRMEPGKGVGELLEHYHRFVSEFDVSLDLVLIGEGSLSPSSSERVHNLGFVTSEQKEFLFQNALVIVNPSSYESFSFVLLEAWRYRKPVLANGNSAVLKGQVSRSSGGFVYRSYRDFKEYLSLLLQDKSMQKRCGENGFQYSKKNYDWSVIEKKYVDFYRYINTNSFLFCKK